MISHRAITALVSAGLALCGLASSAAAQSVTRPVMEAPTIARPEAPKAANLTLQNLPEPPGGWRRPKPSSRARRRNKGR
jgi:hypothetical protein